MIGTNSSCASADHRACPAAPRALLSSAHQSLQRAAERGGQSGAIPCTRALQYMQRSLCQRVFLCNLNEKRLSELTYHVDVKTDLWSRSTIVIFLPAGGTAGRAVDSWNDHTTEIP